MNRAGKYWAEGFLGTYIAFFSPGEGVFVPKIKDGSDASGPSSGTSFATAFVAGTAALWLAHHGHDKLISIARENGEHLQDLFCKAVEMSVQKPYGWDERLGVTWGKIGMGTGIVDAQALLKVRLKDVPLG